MHRKLASLLAADRDLKRLIAHADDLARLQRQVHALMDPELAAHCRVADLTRDTLVLEVDSPAWATRLRYQGNGLLRTLRASPELAAVTQLRTCVRPPQAPAAKERRAHLSEQGAEALRRAADVIDDPALSAALRRLAERSGREK